ncbi:hypothetical protein Mgra_00006488 [Meloidogyne graminicola]|uniref:peptidylprolyl isomerase n=1 Tax=Meloidogyne graminicola TaxID=189291 RepID=A0A8S9ZLA0_9BILA|nr:hypothetical protein Mgra_00006488 [Meloidogyne graminicola]
MANEDNNNFKDSEIPQCSKDKIEGQEIQDVENLENNEEDLAPPEPKKIKQEPPTLKYEQVYLRAIPRASQYEKSFMHRDTITHVLATDKDFIITASQDGHLKFWKKKHNEGIEFVKHFRCHLKEFSDITVNHNGSLLATCCTQDRSVKVFDVMNFDMINMFKFEFNPKIVCFVHQGSDLVNALAISDANSGNIIIIDSNGNNDPIHLLDRLHQRPVILMQYAAIPNVAISIDDMGMIEYWSGTKSNYEFPISVDFKYKMDTDLYEFCKIKKIPRSMSISPNGQLFAIFASNSFIYIFNLFNGKIIQKLDETIEKYIQMGNETKGNGLPAMEWTRRVALEKEMATRDVNAFRYIKLIFDNSSNFIIYPTPLGINVFNLVTKQIVRKIGTNENLRFFGIALCRAVPSVTEKLQGAATSAHVEAADNPNLKISEPDPMLVATAYRKNRFYIFTNVEPYTEEIEGSTYNRDVFNEKPLKEDMITAVEYENALQQSRLSTQATIFTTYGDIVIELYPDKAPKTVENFCTHARRGYYNGHSFHRVIKNFMIQTGDPTGKGTGGNSIWGDDFEDEFHPQLRHDRAFRVSMANAGPNTNGSQFFITVCPAEWLDGKNTIFGQVVEGFNVVQKINQVPVHEKSGRPKDEISIISISLKNA